VPSIQTPTWNPDEQNLYEWGDSFTAQLSGTDASATGDTPLAATVTAMTTTPETLASGAGACPPGYFSLLGMCLAIPSLTPPATGPTGSPIIQSGPLAGIQQSDAPNYTRYVLGALAVVLVGIGVWSMVK
jgi:hypothetical protein